MPSWADKSNMNEAGGSSRLLEGRADARMGPAESSPMRRAPPLFGTPRAVLELRDVSKAFGPVQALSDVSLRLVPGPVNCLAGENGAGKSTLIRVLTGALRRDSGSYEIEGSR